MTMLDFEKCQYSYALSLDKDKNYDYSANGRYGYKVVYTVPSSELANILGTLDDEVVIEGKLEFSVDAFGNQLGEVSLWKSVVQSGGSIINEDFNYFEDITEFVNDFNARANLMRRDILLSQMEERYSKLNAKIDSLAADFMRMRKLVMKQAVVQNNDFIEKESIVNLLRCYDNFNIKSARENYEIVKAIRDILGIDEP